MQSNVELDSLKRCDLSEPPYMTNLEGKGAVIRTSKDP